MHDRFDPRSTASLMAVIFFLIQQTYRATVVSLEGSGIQRIIIEVDSGQVMPKANAGPFPRTATTTAKPPQ